MSEYDDKLQHLSVHLLIDELIGTVSPNYHAWTDANKPAVCSIEAALRKAVIKEAAVAIWVQKENQFGTFVLPNGNYYVVPKEDDVPLFAGLVATKEELAAMEKKEPPC